MALQEIENKKKDLNDIKEQINSTYASAATDIDKKRDAGLTSLQKERDEILGMFDTEASNAKSEIKRTGGEVLHEIEKERDNTMSAIKETTEDAIERLKETDEKARSRLESIEDTLKKTQKNSEVLYDRNGADEKHKSIDEQIENIQGAVDGIDKAMNVHQEGLAYFKSKEDLRKDLCRYYTENYFYVPVTSAIKRQIGTIDDVFFKLTDADFLKQREQHVSEHCKLTGNSYKSIFMNENETYQNILLKGVQKTGKTTWCLNLLYKWVLACESRKENGRMNLLSNQNGRENALEKNEKRVNEEELFLEMFDIVLYIPLSNMAQYNILPDLIKNNTKSPFFQNKDKLTDLEKVLHHEHSKCLIILDDLHKFVENEESLPEFILDTVPALIRQEMQICGDYNEALLPDKQGLEHCFYVWTCRADKGFPQRFRQDQFDRCVSIECVPNIAALQRLSPDKFSECLSKGQNIIDQVEQAEIFRDDSTTFCWVKLETFCGSDLQPFIIFLILNWYETGHIGTTRAINYASTVDFILHLAENAKTGTMGTLENYESDHKLWSDTKAKLPECFEHLPKLKEYSGLILKLAECVFQAQFGVGKGDLNADERRLLHKMGLLIDTKSDLRENGKFYFDSYQVHTCSFHAFLSALHLVVFAQSTNDNSHLDAFEEHCDTYGKLIHKKEILYFLSGMDPSIVSSLSMQMYPCLKSAENTEMSFENPFEICAEEMQYFSEKYPSDQCPIFTTTVRLSNSYELKIWKYNYANVTEVDLNSEKIEKQELDCLTHSQNVRAITWEIPRVGDETYNLTEVTNSCSSLHSLTYVVLSGSGSNYIPSCEKTQNIDLTGCIHIQHIHLQRMSFRNIFVSRNNLVSVKMHDMYECAIKIEDAVENERQSSEPSLVEADDDQNENNDKEQPISNEHLNLAVNKPDNEIISKDTNGKEKDNIREQQQPLPDIMSRKWVHISCRNIQKSKLEVIGRPKNLLAVDLKNSETFDVVMKFPFHSTLTEISKSTVCFVKSVEILRCSCTRLVYCVEQVPKNMNTFTDIYIEKLKFESNRHSGLYSNFNVQFEEVYLSDLSNDINTKEKRFSYSVGMKTPKIDLSVNVADIQKMNNGTLIESLGQMTGLRRVICKDLDRDLWEQVGNVLPKIDRLELLSVEYTEDVPITLFKNIKQIKNLTKLAVIGSKGIPDISRVSNKVKNGLKALATVLKDLHNVQFVDIKNFELWSKQSLSCLRGAVPSISSIKCKLYSENDVEKVCSALPSVSKLINLELVCSAEDVDVEEVLLCLTELKELKHFACSGTSFEDSFPDDASLIDLSHLDSFQVDFINSRNDVPSVVQYISHLTNLKKLSLHAFLSDSSWKTLAEALPQFLCLHTVELISAAGRRKMPVAILESLLLVKELRKLALDFQFEDEESAKEIINPLCSLHQLEVLDLVYETLYSPEFADFFELLTDLSKLVDLQELKIIALSYSFLERKNTNTPATVLPSLQNVHKLTLGKFVRTPAVLLSLQRMENLRNLCLSELDENEWISFGKCLPYLSNLESLETS